MKSPRSAFDVVWVYSLLHGVFFIFFGLLILVMPEILVALVSALFILLGASVLFLGWKFRSLMRRAAEFRDEFYNSNHKING